MEYKAILLHQKNLAISICPKPSFIISVFHMNLYILTREVYSKSLMLKRNNHKIFLTVTHNLGKKSCLKITSISNCNYYFRFCWYLVKAQFSTILINSYKPYSNLIPKFLINLNIIGLFKTFIVFSANII